MLAIIQNESTAVSDQTASAWIPTAQKWMDLVGQEWWFKADVHFATSKDDVTSGDLIIKLRDTSDVAGAAGYHTKTIVNNKAIYFGYSFVGDDIKMGFNPLVTTLHELGEGAVDPDLARVYYHPTGQGWRAEIDEELAPEICDANEADQFGLKIDGVLCSGYVFREWFTGDPRPDGKYDSSGQITRPWQILPGGYIGARSVRASGWTQLTQRAIEPQGTGWECFQMLGDGSHARITPPIGSRRERRARKGAP